MKDRTISIEPVQFEESTRDIILNNTKAGESYYCASFRKLVNVSDKSITIQLSKLSDAGLFEDLGIKSIPKICHNARVFRKL